MTNDELYIDDVDPSVVVDVAEDRVKYGPFDPTLASLSGGSGSTGGATTVSDTGGSGVGPVGS